MGDYWIKLAEESKSYSEVYLSKDKINILNEVGFSLMEQEKFSPNIRKAKLTLSSIPKKAFIEMMRQTKLSNKEMAEASGLTEPTIKRVYRLDKNYSNQTKVLILKTCIRFIGEFQCNKIIKKHSK